MAHAARCLGHLDRHAGDLDLVVEAGMGHPGQHFAGLEVGIGHDVAHVVDGREGHLASEMLKQLLLGALAREVGDGRDQDVLVGTPVLDGDETRIGREFGFVDQTAQDRKVRVCMRRDRHEAVLRGEHAERAEQGMVVALGMRQRVGIGMLVHDALADGEDRIDHAHVHELSLAGLVSPEDRRDDAERAGDRRHDVADTGADLHRRVLVGSGDGHDAAHGLTDDVVRREVCVGAPAGADVAEAADRGVDQLRIASVQRLVAEAEAVHDTAAIVLDHRIGIVAELQDQLTACRRLQVDADRLLVAVHRGKVTAERLELVVGVIGPDDARVIAVKRLDLDHLRALVGQQHGAVGAGQHLREVDDPHPIERAQDGSVAHLSPQ